MGIDIDELIRILPKLIKENDAVKGAIISALSGVVATRDDIQDLIRTIDKRFEEQRKEFNARFEMLLKENVDTNRNIALLKEFNEKRLGVLDKNMKRVLKFVEEIRDHV